MVMLILMVKMVGMVVENDGGGDCYNGSDWVMVMMVTIMTMMVMMMEMVLTVTVIGLVMMLVVMAR